MPKFACSYGPEYARHAVTVEADSEDAIPLAYHALEDFPVDGRWIYEKKATYNREGRPIH